MKELRQAVMVDALRTPFGKADKKRGFFREIRSDDLGVIVLQELMRRTKVDPNSIEETVIGTVEQIGEQAHIGRNVAFLAGLPYEIAGFSVERACVTAMSAIQYAALAIQCGQGDVFVAGGVDSMTHISLPVVTAESDMSEVIKEEGTMLSHMDPNPRLYEKVNPIELVGGMAGEKMVEMYGIPREELDGWALMSNQRAVAAQQAGKFKVEIVPVEGLLPDGTKQLIDYDQGPRADSTLEKIASLPTPWKPRGGTLSAASASGSADGAALAMLMSKEKAEELGMTPLATIRSMAVAGCDPTNTLYSVIPAVRKALARADLSIEDMDLIEINEAFACVPIVFMKEFGIADADRINVNGGACAIGHPVGASGARLPGTLAYEMRRRKVRYGLAGICGGYGVGGAMVLEAEGY